MFIKGLRFGMVLQFAIGPVGLFIFNQSIQNGIISGLSGMAAVTLVDGFYIILAINGIGSMLQQSSSIKKYMSYIGSIVLVLFGLKMLIAPIMDFIGNGTGAPVASIDIQGGMSTFIYAGILTLSSPLTIIFWGGVFAGRMSESDYIKKDIYIFGLGAVSSTVLFQSLLAALGSQVEQLLSQNVITVLNMFVGIFLLYFGFKRFIKEYKIKVNG